MLGVYVGEAIPQYDLNELGLLLEDKYGSSVTLLNNGRAICIDYTGRPLRTLDDVRQLEAVSGNIHWDFSHAENVGLGTPSREIYDVYAVCPPSWLRPSKDMLLMGLRYKATHWTKKKLSSVSSSVSKPRSAAFGRSGPGCGSCRREAKAACRNR